MYEWWLKIEIVTLHANFKDRGYETKKDYLAKSLSSCQKSLVSRFLSMSCAKIHEASVR